MDPLQIPIAAVLIYAASWVYLEVICTRFGFLPTFAVTFAVLWLFGRYIKWSDQKRI